MGSSYKFDLTLSEDGSGGVVLPSKYKPSFPIPSKYKLTFPIPSKYKPRFPIRPRSCSRSSSNVCSAFNMFNMAVAVEVANILLCYHVVVDMDYCIVVIIWSILSLVGITFENKQPPKWMRGMGLDLWTHLCCEHCSADKSRMRKHILWFIRSVQQLYDYFGPCVLVLDEFLIL